MPAHIGILTHLKLPLAFLYQFGPGKKSKSMRSMGLVSPAVVYRAKKADTEKRNYRAMNYDDYREHLDRYDPYYKAQPADREFGGQVRCPPVDKQEWDNYLKPDTSFDQTVAAAIAAGWKITLVGAKSNFRALKRIEAKRTQGAMSITLWSAAGSANGKLFDEPDSATAGAASDDS